MTSLQCSVRSSDCVNWADTIVTHSDPFGFSCVSLDVQKMVKHICTGYTCLTSLQFEIQGVCELGHRRRNDPSVIESVIT